MKNDEENGIHIKAATVDASTGEFIHAYTQLTLVGYICDRAFIIARSSAEE